MKIGLVQMNCLKTDIAQNLHKMRKYIEAGLALGCQLFAFPEMNLTGYANPTQQPESILTIDASQIREVVRWTEEFPICIIFGIIEANPNGKPYITQIVAAEGQILCSYHKIHVVDEEFPLFEPGKDEVCIFEYAGFHLGLTVCADIERPDIFQQLARAGTGLVFEVAAPGLYGDMATRDWESGYSWWRGECFTMLAKYAKDNGIYIAVATQAGRTEDEDFPGGGWVFGPDGECVADAGGYEAGILYFELTRPNSEEEII